MPSLDTVRDPLWPDDLFPFEFLNFAVGQVVGDDVCGLGARVIDVELATVQHHQSAELVCTWICVSIDINGHSAEEVGAYALLLLFPGGVEFKLLVQLRDFGRHVAAPLSPTIVTTGTGSLVSPPISTHTELPENTQEELIEKNTE